MAEYKYKELYLTEKDTQVQALAPILGCVHGKNWEPVFNEKIKRAIVPLMGHVMGLLKFPADYDEAYKQWNDDTIVCFPKEFKREPTNLKMYNNAIRFIKESEKIIIATDFDNEGAALAMEVIIAAGAEDRVEYMLHMGSTAEDALKRALEEKKPIPYKAMAKAGFTRAEIDWADGMSYSRALTIHLGKKKTKLNFGGVKTPIVYTVFERDMQFESHKSLKHYSISGKVKAAGKEFEYSLYRKDDEGKKVKTFEKEEYVNELIKKVKDKKYEVFSFTEKVSKESPEAPYTQTKLQGDASRLYNLTPDAVLDITQDTYINVKITSYPRTEIDAISEDEFKDVGFILGNLSKVMHKEIIEEIISNGIPKRKSVFDSKKVTSHGAIIPTIDKDLASKYSRLADNKKNIVKLIAERYIENFMPDYEYNQINGEVNLFDDIWISFSERIPLRPGFKKLKSPDVIEKIEKYERVIPKLKKGDEVEILTATKIEGETKPKPRFTMETLLEGLAKIENLYPEDPIIKETMKGVGIGTGATRANILKELFDVEKNDGEPWLVMKGKQVLTTDKARQVMKILPKEIASPLKRAITQQNLLKIERGEMTPEECLKEAKEIIEKDVKWLKEYGENPENIVATKKKDVLAITNCPICKKGEIYEHANGKMYLCSSASWENKGTKEKPEWKNNGCNYSIMKSCLSRFGKDTLTKMEVKNLVEKGRIAVKLKSAAKNTEYQKYIEVDEKFGVKVIFNEEVK